MNAEAADALQRAALASMVDTFHTVCKYSNLWSYTAPKPPGWESTYGTWSGGQDNDRKSLTLQFTYEPLGSFVLVDHGSHMDSWEWAASPRLEPQYRRLPGGAEQEHKLGSPGGPLPLDIFEGLWVALHGACREYVWGHGLRPSGFALALFPPL